MRILIAFDKFKDSLTASRACEIAAAAIRASHPDCQVDLCPLSDGGDGFTEVLTAAVDGRLARREVMGPRGDPASAPFGTVDFSNVPRAALGLLGLDDETAPEGTLGIVEMASASGLAMLEPDQRDPMRATSYGTGQLIGAAADSGATMILLGVGGSATHDLGLGALAAMGMDFFSADGRKLRPPVPEDWARLARIRGSVSPLIPPIRIACDVSNPLLGSNGAAAVFAPQKGLRPGDFDRLEQASARVAAQLCDWCGQPTSLVREPGAGAAGGIAFGLMVAAGAQLLPGAALVSAWLDIDARIAAADLVITGEGRYDKSSLGGKGPGVIAAKATAAGRPVHIFAGEIRGGGGANLHSITPAGTDLPRALRDAPAYLAAAVTTAFQDQF
jgi:glycerate kinase